jgi:hypothetical protein
MKKKRRRSSFLIRKGNELKEKLALNTKQFKEKVYEFDFKK